MSVTAINAIYILMDYLTQCEAVISALKKNPVLAELLQANKVDNFTNMAKIIKNERLYKVYNRGEFEKYQFLLEALEHCEGDKILVYFSDINHYALFEHAEQYNDFIKKIVEMRDEDKTISLNHFQIVLAGQQQKLVFIFTGGEQEIDTLRQMIKKEFASDIIINTSQHVEITVQNIIALNHKNSTEIFDKIYNFVYKKNQSLAMQLQRIPLRSECCKNYLQFGLHSSVQYMKLEDLEKLLKSILPGSTASSVNINLIGQINNNSAVNNNENKSGKKEKTKIWISKNLPHEKEQTNDYYNRYKKENKIIVGKTVFGPIVRDFGYDTIRNAEGYMWIPS